MDAPDLTLQQQKQLDNYSVTTNITNNSNSSNDKTKNDDLHVVLLGDSVLDDFYWLSDKKQDVRQQLEDALRVANPKNVATNLALDESTIRSVLYGMEPNPIYAMARKFHGMDPYPVSGDGYMYPIPLLKKTPATHVVLSIGGNDARSAFAQSFDLEQIYSLMMKRGFVKLLDELLNTVKSHVPNVMLVYVYHPQITNVPVIYGLPPKAVVTELLIKFSPIIMEAARKHGIPIIDLSRTFNPYNGSDYGTTPIEPSNQSGLYIVDLIKKVLEDFKFGKDKAKIYSGYGSSIQVEELDASWNEEKYRSSLNEHLKRCEQQQPGCVLL